MASMSQGFSRQILKKFAARDQNEIIFIERSFGKDSIAANLFRKVLVFQTEEVKANKPSSAPTSALKQLQQQSPSEVSSSVTASATSLNKTKDPRKNARANKAAGLGTTDTAIKTAKMPKKTSIEELVSETIMTKGAKSGQHKQGGTASASGEVNA